MAAAVTTKTAKDGASSPATFPMGFLDLSGTGAGPFVPLHALYDSTGALINPATKEGVAAIATALAGTLTVQGAVTVSDGSGPLTVDGTVTVANPLTGYALDTSLGTDGTSAPSLPGGATGVRGWLRLLSSLLPASLGAKLSTASLSMVPASDAVFKVTQSDVSTSGTIAAATASASFVVPLSNGEGVIGFAITGLSASGATLTAEAANDSGTLWAPINLVSPGTGVLSTTTAQDGNYRVNAGGHTNVRLRVTTTGTGTINVAALASSQNPVAALSSPVTLSPNGLGALTAVPAASTNGTPLSASPPAGKRGARLYVPPGASISFSIAAAQPTSAPTTITVANPSTNTVPANWDEDLAGTQMIYVTATTGSPLFRWY